jgi:hypothetical protein
MNNPTSRLCYYAFSSLTLKANGAYRPCSKYLQDIGQSGETLNAARHSVGDAWTADSMRALRQEFLEGKKPAGCWICW